MATDMDVVARLDAGVPDRESPRAEWDAWRTSVREALEEARIEGVRSVTCIRCMRHVGVPVYNYNEVRGGECAACAVAVAQAQLAVVRQYVLEYGGPTEGWEPNTWQRLAAAMDEAAEKVRRGE